MKRLYRKWLNPKLHMYLAYFKKHKRLPNLQYPKRFSEKILWTKLYGNLSRYNRFVDKYEVRKYVEQTIGKEYLNELFDVYNSVDEINFEKLPNSFVLKATHGCGCNIICKEKKKLNVQETREKMNIWMGGNWFFDSKEEQYRDIIPRIIAEKYLVDKSGRLVDYKFFCFNGRVEFIQVLFDRSVKLKRNFRGRDWSKINIKFNRVGNSSEEIQKPEKLSEMVEVAENLSKRFPFVRVDLFSVDNKIYFGELTFTPAGGIAEIEPVRESIRLARLIDIKKYLC